MGTAGYCGYCGYCTGKKWQLGTVAVPMGTVGYCGYCGYCTGTKWQLGTAQYPSVLQGTVGTAGTVQFGYCRYCRNELQGTVGYCRVLQNVLKLQALSAPRNINTNINGIKQRLDS
jgi:hypothetical protein